MRDFNGLYQQVIEELSRKPEPEYKALFEFVKVRFEVRVKAWCDSVYYLRGGEHEADVLQEIQLKVYKRVFKDFFCRNGEFDKDKPLIEFMAWTKVVAESVFRTYLKKMNRLRFVDPLGDKFESDDEGNRYNFAVVGDDSRGPKSIEKQEEARYYLKETFCFVLNLNTKLHIMFSWLVVVLLEVIGNYERMYGTRVAEFYFKDKTMAEMFDYIVKYISLISWLEIPEEYIQNIRCRLSEKIDDSDITLGERTFGSFFQSKNGRASISDWINRINGRIRKELSIKDFNED